jgi:hypothetical protein
MFLFKGLEVFYSKGIIIILKAKIPTLILILKAKNAFYLKV